MTPGLAQLAGMTFSLVLHEVSQRGRFGIAFSCL